ncbi:MAG: DUF1566 domain-containing protein [Bacteroidales bacterium]|nr:DUF1566 domain-containing protein [Bacteroidales bacterium]
MASIGYQMRHIWIAMTWVMAVFFFITSCTSSHKGAEEDIGTDTCPAADGMVNGHEYVDLGLSVNWALCNVGGNQSTEYGDYYAWGIIQPSDKYTILNSKTTDKEMEDIQGNPEFDVAARIWGDPWRIPTRQESEELLSNCTCKWTKLNGVKGLKLTSKINGNFIFLPAGGRIDGGQFYKEELALYWSSTPNVNDWDGAYLIFADSIEQDVYWDFRFSGLLIRPVWK